MNNDEEARSKDSGPKIRAPPEDSTRSRYERWLHKVRHEEDENRKWKQIAAKNLSEVAGCEFFKKCDRKSMISVMTRKVQFCFEAHEDSIKARRQKLLDLFGAEEKRDMRLLIEQGQAGSEDRYQEHVKRLHYLLDKRREEHRVSTEEAPIDKTAHIHPRIVAVRAKEAEKIQLYQMRENQARKMAQRETDNMWRDVALKEAEALAARVEYDAIEEYRRNQQNTLNMHMHMQHIREFRAKEQERLKRETIWFKEQLAEADRKEAEAESRREASRREMVQARNDAIAEGMAALAQKKLDDRLIQDTWDSLMGQDKSDEMAKDERRRQMRRDVDFCNTKMVAIRNYVDGYMNEGDPLIKKEGQRKQDTADLERCLRRKKTRDAEKENVIAVAKQIEEREKVRKSQKDLTAKYNRQVQDQNTQLLKYNEMVEAQVQKQHERDVLNQMEFNNKVIDRAKQDAIEEEKKFRIAEKEYKQAIEKMLCRPSYSQDTHPFMKIMDSGVRMNMALCDEGHRPCPCPPLKKSGLRY